MAAPRHGAHPGLSASAFLPPSGGGGGADGLAESGWRFSCGSGSRTSARMRMRFRWATPSCITGCSRRCSTSAGQLIGGIRQAGDRLAGIHPGDVYRWFIELFVDAYDGADLGQAGPRQAGAAPNDRGRISAVVEPDAGFLPSPAAGSGPVDWDHWEKYQFRMSDRKREYTGARSGRWVGRGSSGSSKLRRTIMIGHEDARGNRREHPFLSSDRV